MTAVLGGAQWKGSCNTTLHFWSNQLSAAGVGEKTLIHELHAEVNTGSDVTFAIRFTPFEAGSFLDSFSELNNDLGSTQMGKGSLTPVQWSRANETLLEVLFHPDIHSTHTYIQTYIYTYMQHLMLSACTGKKFFISVSCH